MRNNIITTLSPLLLLTVSSLTSADLTSFNSLRNSIGGGSSSPWVTPAIIVSALIFFCIIMFLKNRENEEYRQKEIAKKKEDLDFLSGLIINIFIGHNTVRLAIKGNINYCKNHHIELDIEINDDHLNMISLKLENPKPKGDALYFQIKISDHSGDKPHRENFEKLTMRFYEGRTCLREKTFTLESENIAFRFTGEKT